MNSQLDKQPEGNRGLIYNRGAKEWFRSFGEGTTKVRDEAARYTKAEFEGMFRDDPTMEFQPVSADFRSSLALTENDEPLRELCFDYRNAATAHAENYFQRIVRWVKQQEVRSSFAPAATKTTHSDTPRMDATLGKGNDWVFAEGCRLERELAEADRRYDELILAPGDTSSAMARKECPYCTSDNKGIRETYFDQTCRGCVRRMNGGRESVDEILSIVESYGPWGADINEGLRYQIVLADEVKKLRARLKAARGD